MKALLFLLALPVAAAALARSAEDYFHAGANKYVASRLQEAALEVDEGLRNYPGDEKLKMLAGQLRKMKDQQKKDQGQGSSQNSDQKDKNDKDKQNKDQNKDGQGQGQDQKKQDDKKDQDRKDKKDQDKQGQENQDQDQQAAQQNDKQDGDTSGQAATPVKPGQMSKEDAERLLNSYQDDEKKEHSRMGRKARKTQVEEDW